ncbi:Ycf66 family protein [Altericista sp. CCNU0014]|uniref:Ycf66 family protein n=1 Tax=Altericista sp. CCNU0014 TaxID=3082949 RepID=UPI00384ADAC6
MLNHLLAGILGLGSLSLFLSGFFLPELRRKTDPIWSGVGLIYALLLWIEGNGHLLEHVASVSLIIWFGWQTLQQRRQFSEPETQTAIPNSLETLTPFLKAGWDRMRVSYSETADWVQDRLGAGNASIASESLTSPSLQGDAVEDVWEEEDTPASTHDPVPVATAETQEIEPIAPSESEMQVETPPGEVTQQNPVQPEPEALQEATASVPDLSAGEENSSLSGATDASPTAVPEVSNDHPSEAIAVESPSPDLTEEQNILKENTMDEDIAHNSTPEDDDGSWPPKDPVT